MRILPRMELWHGVLVTVIGGVIVVMVVEAWKTGRGWLRSARKTKAVASPVDLPFLSVVGIPHKTLPGADGQHLTIQVRNSGPVPARVTFIQNKLFLVDDRGEGVHHEVRSRGPKKVMRGAMTISAGETVRAEFGLASHAWEAVRSGVLGLRVRVQTDYETIDRTTKRRYKARYDFNVVQQEFLVVDEDTTTVSNAT